MKSQVITQNKSFYGKKNLLMILYLLGHKKEKLGKTSQISFSIGCGDFGGCAMDWGSGKSQLKRWLDLAGKY